MGVEDRRGALGEGMQRLTVVNLWRTTGARTGSYCYWYCGSPADHDLHLQPGSVGIMSWKGMPRQGSPL